MNNNNKKYQLSKKGILKYLNKEIDYIDINCYKSVSSTNTLAKQSALDKAKEGYIVIADSQTCGRGRLGRSFFSPSDAGIYLSIVLRPNNSIKNTLLITTLAAVAVSQAIESVSDKKAYIKWVNDIFVDNKKVCGILSEASINAKNNTPEFVILGIGVNVYKPDGGFPVEISDIAGYIFDEKQNDIKNKLCAKIIERFFFYYNNLDEKDFLVEYRERNFAIGKKITVISGSNEYEADCIGMDDDCCLIVKFENGEEKHISSGEISIRVKK